MSEENKNIPPKQSTENMTEVEHGETPTSNEEINSPEENILPEIEQSKRPDGINEKRISPAINNKSK